MVFLSISSPLAVPTFHKGILLRRLIRSLKDRHSVIPGRLFQLGLEAFFKKQECLLFVFIHKNLSISRSLAR